MNTLRQIRETYNIVNNELANILGVHKNSINTLLDRELNMFTLKQLTSLHIALNVDYNTLLGEPVFTINNIDSKEQTVSILDNDNEYQRLYDKLKTDLKKELTKE